jgi:DNA-binding beta-propeller fold protein YncE
VIGTFESGFYGEDLIFNATGTRLYITDRFNDQVRAFRIDPGPVFTEIAEIPTGATDLDRANPRDLSLSADGATLYAANTLGHTVAVINIAGDANTFVRTMPVGGLTTDVKIAGRWGHRRGTVDQHRPEPGRVGPWLAEDRQRRGHSQ